MLTRKRDREDANGNQDSKGIHPRRKKLRKKAAAEKSSDDQKETLHDPIAETLCQKRSVPVKQTENFSKLPYELVVEIAKRLKLLEDFTCFTSACRTFHIIVKEEYFEGLRFRRSLPYLMLPPVSSNSDGIGNVDIGRQLCSLVEGESIVGEVPALTSSMFCLESLGWLLTLELDGSMSLLDPFSDTKIPVPHLHTFPRFKKLNADKRFLIKKMVLSSRPNETSDFILMVIIGDSNHLAFWRLGDKAWNKIDGWKGSFRDVVYVGGEQFYAIDCRGGIWVINLAGGRIEWRIIIERIYVLCTDNCLGLYILKTIDGSLLGINRIKEQKYLLTSEFQVYEIDIATCSWEKINSLGRMAVFLGRNSSFAVDAVSNGGGVINANHIYFTDDLGEYQNAYFNRGPWTSYCRSKQYAIGRGVDNGVYNFETGVIESTYPVKPLLRNVCPAMWITPNLCF